MKVVFWILGGLFLLFLVFGGFIMYGLNSTRRMVIGEVDLSKVNDGKYQGEYSKGRFTYKVMVTVEDHQIKDVTILNNNMLSEITDKIIAAIKDKQSLKMDAVSGASVTTNAVLKAVENALAGKVQ